MPSLLPLFAAYFVAVVSPGPDVLAVLRIASTRSRRAGLATAFGVTTGNAAWIGSALLGVTAASEHNARLFTGVRVAGGLVLAGFGVLTLLSARRPSAFDSEAAAQVTPAGRSWVIGLATNLSNPKALVFFGALFADLLPHHAAADLRATAFVGMIAISMGWFSLVAVIGSTDRVVAGYRRSRRRIDLVTGSLFVGLGLAVAAA